MALALALLVAGLFLPWWGFTEITLDPEHAARFEETVQFNPWVTTRWYTITAPLGFYGQAIPQFWWDSSRRFPEYAGYAPVSAVLCALWVPGFALIALAIWARGVPRRRMRGLPTLAEGTAAALVGVSLLVAYLGFPSAGQLTSFAGGSVGGPSTWGPGLGFYEEFVVLAFLVAATATGFRVDRRMRSVCWYCLRPVMAIVCGYCQSRQ